LGRSWFRGAWLALLLNALASVAHASPVVIVPPRAEAGIDSDVVERAVTELMRVIRAQGLDPISPGQAGASAEEARENGGFRKSMNPNECLSTACAAEYRQLFDASFAVQLSLFADEKRAGSVVVVITETPDAYFSGNAEIEGGDVQAAVRVAYLAARDKHMQGAGPWLSVAGTPEGAAVYVDDHEFGSLPIDRRHIEPGAHRVQVRREGFVARSFSVEIPEDIDHDERLHAALSALDEPRVDRTWDYVLGSALAAAGAFHLALGAYQMSKVGECAEREDGTCTEVYGDEHGVRQEPLLIGLGAAGLAAGGLVMGLAPIGHLRLRAGKDSALIAVGGAF
jgi:PEGA domain